MDSVVDSFFPLLEQVEKEMFTLEIVMFSEEESIPSRPSVQEEKPPKAEQATSSDTVVSQSGSSDNEKKTCSPDLAAEKVSMDQQSILHTQFAIPRRHLFSLRRIKAILRNLGTLISRKAKVKTAKAGGVSHSTVHRVARVRRLVTSLSRILATKSEVVAQVKKRLLMTGESGLATGTTDDHQVFVYLGDVQGMLLEMCTS